MFRVSVIYPNDPATKFDFDYFMTTHKDLVLEKCKPLGLVRFEVDKGSGDPPAFLVKADMVFESEGAFETTMEQVGADLMGDVPNFTNAASEIQFGEVVVSQ